jgi:hypothetical protein
MFFKTGYAQHHCAWLWHHPLYDNMSREYILQLTKEMYLIYMLYLQSIPIEWNMHSKETPVYDRPECHQYMFMSLFECSVCVHGDDCSAVLFECSVCVHGDDSVFPARRLGREHQ